MKYLLILFCLCCISTSALAQSEYSTTISISPFHLQFPIVKITGEFSTKNGGGAAFIAGYGVINDKHIPAFTVMEIGTQYNYYIVGNFKHGMQVGAEALFVRISGYYSGSSDGKLSIGPYAGYKYASAIGPTMGIQGGYFFSTGLLNASPNPDLSTKNSGVFLNFTIGFSF